VTRTPRRMWTTLEIIELAAMWNAGCPAAQIAEHLDRTVKVVYNRVRRMNLARRQPPNWTRGQERILEAMVMQAVALVCERTGRPPSAVEQRMASYLMSKARRRRHEIRDVGGMQVIHREKVA
jgi:transposase